MSVLLTLLLAAAICLHVRSFPGTATRPGTVTQEGSDNTTLEAARVLASIHANFAFSLFKNWTAQNPESNVIFSPLGISMAMASMSLEAPIPVLTVMLEDLKFNLSEIPEDDVRRVFQMVVRHLSWRRTPLPLTMSTALVLDQELKETQGHFLQQMQALYDADTITTDFLDLADTKRLINDYVEQRTQGKIRDFIKHLDERLKMMMVNSHFSKAKWKMPFNPRHTFKSDFHVSESRKVKVPMMKAETLDVPYFRDETLGCTVVELPNTGTIILLILPDEGHMAAVEAALLPATLHRWRESLKTRNITLYLPKLSVSRDFGRTPSQEEGLSDTAEDETPGHAQVAHWAMLNWAEEGVEVLSAMASPLMSRSIRRITVVKFDRPFLLAIMSEDPQTTLFLGKVVNPLQA